MKPVKLQSGKWILAGGAMLSAVVLFANVTTTSGYPRYNSTPPGGNCVTCHGDFDDNTSPKGTIFPNGGKHGMHRNPTDMSTSCLLCHFVIGDNPLMFGSAGTVDTPGLGCAGCHAREYGGQIGLAGAGLRRHHLMNNVTVCGICHTDDPIPLPESIDPPYYGSPDTAAFDACNTGPVFGENWSLDADNTRGLDNDGDQLYDGTDDDCGGCPWDCGGDNDGNIGIVDFLEVLAQWGSKSGSCDFGEGEPGVGINEFLTILSKWGPCS
jgi:hypothetical protein